MKSKTDLDSNSISDLEMSIGMLSDSSHVSCSFVASDQRELRNQTVSAH
jgi:hypothetical protein